MPAAEKWPNYGVVPNDSFGYVPFSMTHAKILLFAFLAFLTNCGDAPLAKPELLNHPQHEWAARGAKMDAGELYDVYRYYLSLKPPHDTGFAEVLGQKGKAAVEAWIADATKNRSPRIDRPWLYGPIIEQASRVGGYDLCSDPPTFAAASDALIVMKVARQRDSAQKAIRQQCDRFERKLIACCVSTRKK